jgi:hypothetical protein
MPPIKLEWIAVTLLLALSVSVHGQDEASISVDMTQHHGRKGDNVTFSCRAVNPGENGIGIFKTVKMENPDGEMALKYDQITVNKLLYPKYAKDSDRFSIREFRISNTKSIFLDIQDVTHEDSGHYACRMMDDAEVYAELRFVVHKQPSHVAFHNGTDPEPLVDGSVLELDEGESIDLMCMVNGAIPQPHVNITAGETNYTNQFSAKSSMVLQCEGTDSKCPIHNTYNKILTRQRFTLKPEDHGKELVCNASVGHMAGDHVTSTLKLVVNFKPFFNCSTDHKAKHLEKNKIMRCRVRFHPAPLKNITLSIFEKEEMLKPGDNLEGVQFETKNISDTELELIVTIPEVTEKHFGVYDFNVANRLGINSATLRLVSAGSDASTDDGANAISCSFLSITILTLAAIFLHH